MLLLYAAAKYTEAGYTLYTLDGPDTESLNHIGLYKILPDKRVASSRRIGPRNDSTPRTC